MKLLGLNSPEIFLILVIILSILGTKRIEKGWLLFQRFLKFLLNKEKTKQAKSEKPEVMEVKEEVKEEVIEAKSEKPEVMEVKEKAIEADLNKQESKATIIKK